jgi:hypothetical protein
VRYWTCVALLSTAYPFETARAQQLASPFGTVSQRIDSTTMTMEYYRPSARGRAIFGRLVRWGEMWTPGANWATTLEVNRDVRIEGQLLPGGKYSVWVIPGPDSWIVTLSRAARRFHTQRAVQEEQLRVTVRPDSGPHVEVLTFSFPEVTREGATLQLAWANTVVPIRLQIGSAQPAIVAAHPWSSYAGVYELRELGDGGSAGKPFRYEVIERGNGLWVRTGPEAVEVGLDPEFDLVPAGGDQFHPRQYKNGKLVGVEADELVVFHLEGARATGFEIRGIAEAKVLARAIRSPRP